MGYGSMIYCLFCDLGLAARSWGQEGFIIRGIRCEV
jgi:hypothetical protein